MHRLDHARLALIAAVFLALAACSTDADNGAPAGADAGLDAGGGADSSSADANATDTAATGQDAGAQQDTQSTSGKLWAVGVTTVQTKGAGGRMLPTEIWYPVEPGTKGTVTKYLQGLVASPYGAMRDVEAAKGPFPLVAFSHGNQGVRDQSVFLTEGLARHGYVVVSPAHVGNTTLDFDAKLAGVMVLWRPQDLKAAIDRVEKPESSDPAWLKGLADTSKVAVTGHSFGGYTTLAVAGIAVDVPQAASVDCNTRPEDDPLCKEQKKLGAPPWDFGDKRVKVAIPLAHAMYAYHVLSHASAKKLQVPMVIMSATGDKLTPHATEAAPLYKDLTSPKALWTLEGGGHMSFANICEVAPFAPANLKAEIAALCGTNAKPTMAQTHASILEHALAAVDIYLKGKDEPRATFKAKPKGQHFYTLQSEGIVQP